MWLPTAAESCCATFSSRVLKYQICGATPPTTYSASSPSYVLQIQPFFENFCNMPARSPSEYDQDSENQVHNAAITTTRTSRIMRMRPKRLRRLPPNSSTAMCVPFAVFCGGSVEHPEAYLHDRPEKSNDARATFTTARSARRVAP